MRTRAKLVCTNITDIDNGVLSNPEKIGENILFEAQYSDIPEDNIWSKYTPLAMFSMNVTNPDIYGTFDINKAYYFDITPVEA